MPALSVVIPTHERAELLRQALEHLERQTIASDLEVIVVSDGPDVATRELAARIQEHESSSKKAFASFQFLEIPKCQQGIARNRGVAKATAPVVMFSQDDIFLAPNACAVHVVAHGKFPRAAVLGFTTWDPACVITPVMTWLEATGWQFGYPHLVPYAHRIVPAEMQHRYTYTSHISVPTKDAKCVAFREDVALYGWEDIEWGLRLRKEGLSLVYEPDATALHHHHLELADSLRRMETIGRSAVHIELIAPELSVTPKGWKRWAYEILSWLPTLRGRHTRAFLRGLRQV